MLSLQGNSPTQDHLTVKQIYQSSSLSRFDYVRRRQIIRMKKRSNWFLAPNMSATSADSHSSFLGSRDRSVGRSSFDGTSSDALMSDVTDRSDGGLSDTHFSEGMQHHRMSTEVDSSFLDTSHDQSLTGSEIAAPTATSFGSSSNNPPLRGLGGGGGGEGSRNYPAAMRSKLHAPDFINGNHSASGTSPSLTPSPRPSTPSHSSITEKDVRCFMVENWYGSPASQGSHSWNLQTIFRTYTLVSCTIFLFRRVVALRGRNKQQTERRLKEFVSLTIMCLSLSSILTYVKTIIAHTGHYLNVVVDGSRL